MAEEPAHAVSFTSRRDKPKVLSIPMSLPGVTDPGLSR